MALHKWVGVVALMLMTTGCLKSNVKSVDLCVNNDDGALATVQLINPDDSVSATICKFETGTTCEKVTQARQVKIVEKLLVHSRCKTALF